MKANGSLYAWGYNQNGELGLGDYTKRIVPTRVGFLNIWSDVDAGQNFSTASPLTSTYADPYTWGYNGFGQLGTGDYVNRNNPVKIIVQ